MATGHWATVGLSGPLPVACVLISPNYKVILANQFRSTNRFINAPFCDFIIGSEDIQGKVLPLWFHVGSPLDHSEFISSILVRIARGPQL